MNPNEGTPRIVDAGRLWYALKDRPIDARRALPKPARALSELKADLDTHGYCLVANALSEAACQAIRQRVREQMAAEKRLKLNFTPPQGFAVVSNLLNKGDIFQQLLLEPLTEELVEHLLGRSFLLSALSANCTLPGSAAQGLHIDQHFAGFPAPIALVANVCWMIDDFTAANGATRIMPGSHRWSSEELTQRYQGINGAEDGRNAPGTLAAEGRAGTAMVFDGRLAHGAGQNCTHDSVRIGIFEYACRGWIRGVENPFLSISDDVMAALPRKIRDRLGYRPSGFAGGYQMAGNPAPIDVVRPTDQIRELK